VSVSLICVGVRGNEAKRNYSNATGPSHPKGLKAFQSQRQMRFIHIVGVVLIFSFSSILYTVSRVDHGHPCHSLLIVNQLSTFPTIAYNS